MEDALDGPRRRAVGALPGGIEGTLDGAHAVSNGKRPGRGPFWSDGREKETPHGTAAAWTAFAACVDTIPSPMIAASTRKNNTSRGRLWRECRTW